MRAGHVTGVQTCALPISAVQLADHGGLEAATLPKVAEALNVTAMSLYRHIGSKQELLQLMMDAASEPPGPERSEERRVGKEGAGQCSDEDGSKTQQKVAR